MALSPKAAAWKYLMPPDHYFDNWGYDCGCPVGYDATKNVAFFLVVPGCTNPDIAYHGLGGNGLYKYINGVFKIYAREPGEGSMDAGDRLCINGTVVKLKKGARRSLSGLGSSTGTGKGLRR